VESKQTSGYGIDSFRIPEGINKANKEELILKGIYPENNH